MEIKDGSVASITPTINAAPPRSSQCGGAASPHHNCVKQHRNVYGGVHGLRTCVHVHTHGAAFKQSIDSLCVLKSSLVQKLWIHEKVEESRTSARGRARGGARGRARGAIPTARSDHQLRPNLRSTSSTSSPGSSGRIQAFLMSSAWKRLQR